MDIRIANNKDIDQLMKLRWEFTEEYSKIDVSYDEYYKASFNDFLEILNSPNWVIWIAEINGKIISHIYLEKISKVPRPGKTTNAFGYMTNVYTVPEFRSKGIGSKLI